VKPPRLGKGVRALPRLNIVYPGICLTIEEYQKTCQGSRKVLGWSAPNAIRLIELAIAGNGLDGPAGSYRPWRTPKATGSSLGQRRYLPSCHTRGFPRQLTLSRTSQSGLWCGRQTAEHTGPRVSACYVPGGTSSKAETLGLQHLWPPDMGAGSGPPSGARIIHHGADELLI